MPDCQKRDFIVMLILQVGVISYPDHIPPDSGSDPGTVIDMVLGYCYDGFIRKKTYQEKTP